jgi:hypothetical protein
MIRKRKLLLIIMAFCTQVQAAAPSALAKIPIPNSLKEVLNIPDKNAIENYKNPDGQTVLHVLFQHLDNQDLTKVEMACIIIKIVKLLKLEKTKKSNINRLIDSKERLPFHMVTRILPMLLYEEFYANFNANDDDYFSVLIRCQQKYIAAGLKCNSPEVNRIFSFIVEQTIPRFDFYHFHIPLYLCEIANQDLLKRIRKKIPKPYEYWDKYFLEFRKTADDRLIFDLVHGTNKYAGIYALFKNEEKLEAFLRSGGRFYHHESEGSLGRIINRAILSSQEEGQLPALFTLECFFSNSNSREFRKHITAFDNNFYYKSFVFGFDKKIAKQFIHKYKQEKGKSALSPDFFRWLSNTPSSQLLKDPDFLINRPSYEFFIGMIFGEESGDYCDAPLSNPIYNMENLKHFTRASAPHTVTALDVANKLAASSANGYFMEERASVQPKYKALQILSGDDPDFGISNRRASHEEFKKIYHTLSLLGFSSARSLNRGRKEEDIIHELRTFVRTNKTDGYKKEHQKNLFVCALFVFAKMTGRDLKFVSMNSDSNEQETKRILRDIRDTFCVDDVPKDATQQVMTKRDFATGFSLDDVLS